MSAPLLIAIQGAPGVGKTTLCRELVRRTKLPALSKDYIKEDLLYNRLEQSDRDFSRLEGEAAVMMLYAFATTFLKKGHSVIIENAFYTEVSRPDIRKVIAETGADFLEVFCFTDESVRVERFASRVENGERHPGHLDTTIQLGQGLDNYPKLELGNSIDVDTTEPPTELMYQKITAAIQKKMEG